jgi:hypothetical protein
VGDTIDYGERVIAGGADEAVVAHLEGRPVGMDRTPQDLEQFGIDQIA